MTLSDGWPMPGTSLDMALDCLQAAGPTASTNGTNKDHVVVKSEMVQQLVTPIACLITVGTKPGGGWWVKGSVRSQSVW